MRPTVSLCSQRIQRQEAFHQGRRQFQRRRQNNLQKPCVAHVSIYPIADCIVSRSRCNKLSVRREHNCVDLLSQWPSSAPRQLLVDVSHSLTVMSKHPEAMSFPSGENTTAMTQSAWPSRTPRGPPVDVSHSLTVLSEDEEARSPSLENTTALTHPE